MNTPQFQQPNAKTIRLPKWMKHLFLKLDDLKDQKDLLTPQLQALMSEEDAIMIMISTHIRNNNPEALSHDISLPISWRVIDRKKLVIELAQAETAIFQTTHPRYNEVCALSQMGVPSSFILQFVDLLDSNERPQDENSPDDPKTGGG